MNNIKNRLTRMQAVVAATALFITAAPGLAWSHDRNQFDDHWLAAACTQVPVGGRITGIITNREFGVAVGARAHRSLELYCNVEADSFHNFIQVIAEDNSPYVHVTATLYQQNIDTPEAPTAIASVTTTDQPGLQVADLFFDPPVEPDEFFYMYFIKIEIVRENSDPVWVYRASLRDVL